MKKVIYWEDFLEWSGNLIFWFEDFVLPMMFWVGCIGVMIRIVIGAWNFLSEDPTFASHVGLIICMFLGLVVPLCLLRPINTLLHGRRGRHETLKPETDSDRHKTVDTEQGCEFCTGNGDPWAQYPCCPNCGSVKCY